MSSKNVLFYSNYCNFSKEILGEITKRNIRDLFVLICVDQNRYNIPSFVDRVPLIVTTQKQIVTDDDVLTFITELHKHHGSTEISAYTVGTSRIGMFSDQYSFIEEDSGRHGNHGMPFVFIEKEGDMCRIQTPDDDGHGNGTGNQKLDMSILENLKAQRDMDVQKLVGSRPI